MMESVRVRLVFEDRHVLSKSQRTEGLKRSWLLFNTEEYNTISDLCSYLLNIFDLNHSCPNGLILSMDGFVLPPFESTCILKDEDIICVKKKGGTFSDIIKVGDEANLIEELEIVEKQPVHTVVPLLANEEFEKETGSYKSESKEDEEGPSQDTLPVEISRGDNAVSKKRKASKKLQSSKTKKHHSAVPGVENDVREKEKVSDVMSKLNKESTPEISQRCNNNVESTLSLKGSDQLQENSKGIEEVSHVPQGTRKIPSRSARRKKSKRQWLRELAQAEKKDTVYHSKGHASKQGLDKPEKKEEVTASRGLLHWKPLPEKDVIEQEKPNQNSDAEHDVVPIVIRPGHIRFEPLEEDEVVQQSQVSVETFQWNGITSKKKGQKWGKEKFSTARRNDYKDSYKEYSEMLTNEKVIPVNDPIDFDKLPFLTSLPKEGDVIAYRLLELSSSWTPELSSYRVGSISKYDAESSRIMLMPVPEYPVVSEKLDEDASALQPDNSLYREDGSLEIEFSSLVDVRIVKQSNSDTAKGVTGRVNSCPPGNDNAISSLVPSNNGKQTEGEKTATPESGKVNLWDQFSQDLNAKKAQLSEENDVSKGSPGKSSWSYKALRSSALGPTMAILRAKNDI